MMFAVGDEIIASKEPGFYPAKVLKIGENRGKMSYLIHFIGWSRRHDQWIPIDQADGRLFEKTPENQEKFIGTGPYRPFSQVPATGKTKFLFSIGEKFLCTHHSVGVQHPAEVEKIEDHKGIMSYYIHYSGWNRRYDEWIPVGEEEGKMVKL